MTIHYHPEIIQGSDEWYSVRCGLLTASQIKLIVTPKKLEIVKDPAHLYDLAAQQVTNYIEPQWIGDDMIRGHEDEILAKAVYSKHYAQTTDVGFITNDVYGFTLGYSPDALVGDEGLLECKSQCQKFHMETVAANEMDDGFRIQVQAGMMISERKWCDFISYCGGMPMFVKRIEPDFAVQAKIIEAAHVFHTKLDELVEKYRERVATGNFIETERRKPQEEMHE